MSSNNMNDVAAIQNSNPSSPASEKAWQPSPIPKGFLKAEKPETPDNEDWYWNTDEHEQAHQAADVMLRLNAGGGDIRVSLERDEETGLTVLCVHSPRQDGLLGGILVRYIPTIE
jgi:hypothetical protein